MKVELAVTRSCHHCAMLEAEFKKLGVPYSICYLEDDPEMQQKYGIKGSPNILVDGELAFRGMPSFAELEKYFKERSGK